MEFEIAGQTYRAGKLNAKQQLHVSRRLAPLFAAMAPALKPGVSLADMPVEPLAEALAGLPDAAVDYVVDTCLSVVQRQQGPAWQFVWNKQAQAMQFADIEMPAMLQIVAQVIMENLRGFTAALPPALSQAAAGLSGSNLSA